MLPPPMQDSLPGGWLAFSGRESNPLDCVERFPSCYISVPLSWIYPDAMSPLPRRSSWAYIRSLNPAVSAFPDRLSGRPAHCPFRGLLGVHSRYGLHTRAVTVYRDTLPEGF